jgi:GDPmannose 4,6-dehydratase
MWLMLQEEVPDDFLIATGESHSVKEFVEEAFRLLGLDWQKHVEFDDRYVRPTEVDTLLGDFSKARNVLGWKPKVTFKDLVRMMVEADLELAKCEAHMRSYNGESSRFEVRRSTFDVDY